MVEKLVEQIESRFAELSEQMADPEVIADRERYAEVGREYRALEPAHELAREWRTRVLGRRGRARDAGRGRRRRRAARAARELRGAPRRARRGDPAGHGRAGPERRQERDRGGAGGQRAGRRPGCSPATSTGCSPATPSGAASQRAAVGRRRRLHLRGQGRRRLQRLQARGRHPPRPAGARDRVAGPHPHLDRHGGGAAGGRGGRGPDRPERPPGRRLPLLRDRAASR